MFVHCHCIGFLHSVGTFFCKTWNSFSYSHQIQLSKPALKSWVPVQYQMLDRIFLCHRETDRNLPSKVVNCPFRIGAHLKTLAYVIISPFPLSLVYNDFFIISSHTLYKTFNVSGTYLGINVLTMFERNELHR